MDAQLGVQVRCLHCAPYDKHHYGLLGVAGRHAAATCGCYALLGLHAARHAVLAVCCGVLRCAALTVAASAG